MAISDLPTFYVIIAANAGDEDAIAEMARRGGGDPSAASIGGLVATDAEVAVIAAELEEAIEEGAFDPASPGAIGATSAGAGYFSNVFANRVGVNGLFPACEDALTAGAGGGRAAALTLTGLKFAHRVGTCATAGDSLMLPSGAALDSDRRPLHLITNDGAASAQIFPNDESNDTINGVNGATGVALAAGKSALLYARTDNHWIMITLNAGGAASSMHCAQLRLSAPDPIAGTGTPEKVLLDATDVNEGMTIQGNGIVATQAGKYLVIATLLFLDMTAANTGARIYKNGGIIAGSHRKAAADSGTITLSLIIDMAIGDFVNLWAAQNSGGSVDVYGAAQYYTGLSVQQIR